jgi:osomolarity two-component system response regulator SSK1
VPPDRRVSSSRRASESEAQPSSAGVSFSSFHTASTPPHLGMEPISSQDGSGSTPESKARVQGSLGVEDQESAEPLQVPALPVTRRPSPIDNIGRKVSSPPGSPLSDSRTSSSAPRRAPGRRFAVENKMPAQGGSKKGKGAADSNIVPPISVLVVDGACIACRIKFALVIIHIWLTLQTILSTRPFFPHL